MFPNEDWYVKEIISDKLDDCWDEGHATVVNNEENFYFDIVFTDETAETLQNTMNGICASCHKKHQIHSLTWYKPDG